VCSRVLILTLCGFLTVGVFVSPSTQGQHLSAEPAFSLDAFIDPTDPLRFELSEPVSPDAGHLALFIDTHDLTPLLRTDSTSVTYVPERFRLPGGERQLTLYFVSRNGSWEILREDVLRVRSWAGFEEASIDPGLTVNNKGQVLHDTTPEPSGGGELYQDFSGQASLHTELRHARWAASVNGTLVGVSNREEALRFRDLADDAPRIDLSDFHVDLTAGPVETRFGHLQHGNHRHLIRSFRSRGVRSDLAIGDVADLTLALSGGSRVVGWRDLSGITEPDHRVFSATASADLVSSPQAALRLEGTLMEGSVLPRNSFNRSSLPDAERSRGGALKVEADALNRRIQLEGGYAISRFTNPEDPNLSQGNELVAVETTTHAAHYLDVGSTLIRSLDLGALGQGSLQTAYRRERVAPLYRTIGTFVRSDMVQDALELNSRLGTVQLRGGHVRTRDNLDEIPSILTTKTREYRGQADLPLGDLLRSLNAPTSIFWPTLSYAYQHTHQFGAEVPVDGGFGPSHVPDQTNDSHTMGAAWQGSSWGLNYRFNTSFQDNRQEGREAADFLNQTHTVGARYRSGQLFNVSVDLNWDRNERKEDGTITYNRRVGTRAQLRPHRSLSFSGAWSPTRTHDNLDQRLRTSLRASLEATYTLDLGTQRAQLFIRAAQQSTRSRDFLRETDDEQRSWTINTGVSLTLL